MARICSKCKQEKDSSLFYKNERDGSNNMAYYYCLKCFEEYRRAVSRKHYNNNKKKEARRKKQYYIDNKEKCIGRDKAYYENNKEKCITKDKEYYMENKDKYKKRYEKYRIKQYGITIEEYNTIFETQDGCCAICGAHQSALKNKLCIDHDHETDEVRGLLCSSCNKGLGIFKDDTNALQKAIEYLIKNKK